MTFRRSNPRPTITTSIFNQTSTAMNQQQQTAKCDRCGETKKINPARLKRGALPGVQTMARPTANRVHIRCARSRETTVQIELRK